MKDNTHNRTDSAERKSYKKKFLLRKHQEIEAEEEIKEFKEDDEDCPDVGESPKSIRD